MTPPTRTRIINAPQHRNFDEEMPAPPLEEGPTFKLGGEEFHCLPRLAGGVLPRLVRAVGVDPRGRAVTNPDVLLFMEEVLCDEMPVAEEPAIDPENPEAPTDPVMVLRPVDDVDRWRALMEDKRRPIEAETLGAVVSWLIEWYTGRPTAPSGR